MKLFINGREAVKGQEVTDFRGDKAILIGWTEPQKPGSSGRVMVKLSPESSDYDQMEYYPGVYGGEFK